jgi:hypothetical protein
MTTYTQAQTAWTNLMQSFVQGSNTFTNSGVTYNQAMLSTATGICGNLSYNSGGSCPTCNFSNEVIVNMGTVQAYYSSTYYNASTKTACPNHPSAGCSFYKMLKSTFSNFNDVLPLYLDGIITTGTGAYNFDSSLWHGVTSIIDINGCDSGALKGVTSIVNAWMMSNNVQLPFISASQLPQ